MTTSSRSSDRRRGCVAASSISPIVAPVDRADQRGTPAGAAAVHSEGMGGMHLIKEDSLLTRGLRWPFFSARIPTVKW